MARNQKYLEFSQYELEPKICSELNNLFAGQCEFNVSTNFEDMRQKVDIWMRPSIDMWGISSNDKYGINVKTIEQKNNRGIYTNFSLPAQTINGTKKFEFIIFAYPKTQDIHGEYECYVCKYDDVKNSRFLQNRTTFYLCPLSDIKHTSLYTFTINI